MRHTSKSRKQGERERDIVMEALDTLGGKGTVDQIIELTEGDIEFGERPRSTISFYLRTLSDQGLVEEKRGLWYVSNQSPNGSAIAATANEGQPVKLAEFQANRAKQTVTIYQSPMEIPDTVAVWVYYQAGQVFKVPLAGGLNVCTGPEIPKWSPEQETNYGIKMLRFVRKDTTTVDVPCDPKLPITFNFVE